MHRIVCLSSLSSHTAEQTTCKKAEHTTPGYRIGPDTDAHVELHSLQSFLHCHSMDKDTVSERGTDLIRHKCSPCPASSSLPFSFSVVLFLLRSFLRCLDPFVCIALHSKFSKRVFVSRWTQRKKKIKKKIFPGNLMAPTILVETG